MAEPEGLSVAEWQAAWLDAQKAGEASVEGVTTVELADVLGVCKSTASKRLNDMIDAGVAEYAGRRPALTRDQRPTTVPVYRLKGGEG